MGELRGEYGGDDVETTANHLERYDERLDEITTLLMGGAPARSCAAWASAVRRALERDLPCPTWPELEMVAPSVARR